MFMGQQGDNIGLCTIVLVIALAFKGDSKFTRIEWKHLNQKSSDISCRRILAGPIICKFTSAEHSLQEFQLTCNFANKL